MRALAMIDDPTKWTVNITYVAHGFAEQVLSPHTEIDGVTVNVTQRTFGVIFDDVLREVSPQYLVDSFNTYVTSALNAKTASEELRRTYAEIAGLKLEMI
jgi:hypothetical protein